MVWAIVACEVGFWVLLAAGLVARYGLRLGRVSAVLLISVPLVDVVLLALTTIDLSRGAVATGAHGLAAAYLGFSVVYGHRTIKALDQRVAHRFAGGPAPVKPATSGPEATSARRAECLRVVGAWAIACTLLLTAILVVNDPTRTQELESWILWLTGGAVVLLVTGPGLSWLRNLAPRSSRVERQLTVETEAGPSRHPH